MNSLRGVIAGIEEHAHHLPRCNASCGDLSGAAEEAEEVYGSWKDAPGLLSPPSSPSDASSAEGESSWRDLRRKSKEYSESERVQREVVLGFNPKDAKDAGKAKKSASRPHERRDVWEQVFNPGRNYHMNRNYGASRFDRPAEGKKHTVWDEIVKAETIRELGRAGFDTLDRDHDGYVDANELRMHLRPSSPGKVENLMKLADKDRDGKINLEEFMHLLKQS
eukprot:CAMPEP_0119118486 /NCGR_PEP_ID=MMETSP1310-20130426/342_1 /TAXON_ID=464262 /ORGANISM="Genus nov. species nov., Strain RCC2339" /LENGTH=221 /DNA_ID=CAMNT_0007107853 /DNA_START=205 /DNA_END=870 /DNA_ORIENTATION=+